MHISLLPAGPQYAQTDSDWIASRTSSKTHISWRNWLCLGIITVLSLAISGLADDDTTPAPEHVLRDAVCFADRATGPDRGMLYLAIAVAYTRAGDPQSAIGLANTRVSGASKTSIIDAVAITQARLGDIAGAIRTARSLSGEPYWHTIIGVATVQVYLGKANDAKELMRTELRTAPPPFARRGLKMIGLAQERAGDFRGAAATFDSIPDPVEKARGCRALASSRLEAGDFQGALTAAKRSRELLAEALKDRQPEKQPTVLTAERFYDGILFDIASSHAKRKDFPAALESATSISDSYTRIMALARLAQVFARAADRVSATALVRQARELLSAYGCRGFELTEIATAEALLGDRATARRTYLEALKTVGDAVNQGIVAKAQARAGDSDGALETLQAITDRAARDSALRHLASVLAQDDNLPKALGAVELIASIDSKALALCAVCDVQAEIAQRAAALSTIRRATVLGDGISGETVRAIARRLSGISSLGQAIAWASSRGEPSRRAWGLLGAVEGTLRDLPKVNLLEEFP